MKSVREAAAPDGAGEAPWFLYILRCGDGSFYTGITNDIERRLKAHQDGKASRYTRTRRPVDLVYREACGGRSLALARECAVKALSRERKEKLITPGCRRPARPHPGSRRT
ncbi:MAG: GIY-YIG nuclease family protein [Candidatus Aminicenantes bacterium]|nr:GIY-YIG nuclease family protein [Candidatus Aminicenantes bacterium]